MLSTTTITLRQSRRNSSTIRPVRAAQPQALRWRRPTWPAVTYGRLVEFEADVDVLGQHRLHASADCP